MTTEITWNSKQCPNFNCLGSRTKRTSPVWKLLTLKCAPNIGAPQYVRQMLTSMKGEINSNTIIVGVFNNPLTPMDRSTKQKINKETQT